MDSYTVEQVRAAERTALKRQGGGPLMLRAARKVELAAVGMVPRPLPGRRVVLLVGVGNNGGDALFAGAGLSRRGVQVTAVLASPERAHAAGLSAFRRAGGEVVHALSGTGVDALLGRADLVIDGLVGIGAVPPLRPPSDRLVTLANASGAARLAVDLPSGVHPDHGDIVEGPVFDADRTVTFGGPTTGLLLSAATGQLQVESLDFPLAGGPSDARVLDDAEAAALLPSGGPADDKYRNGVLGIAAGSEAYPGAAVLCTGGAVRTRPGMVRFAGGSRSAVVARWPEVVATDTVQQAGRVQAWVVGPGLGLDDSGRTTLRTVLRTDVPVLVDADGLTALVDEADLLRERRNRGLTTVLTPHAAEFRRLFPDLDPAGRLAAVRAAAADSGALVLLKGHRTVIADPAGRTVVNLSGTGWLATAGSGDVLSGVIGSLLAAGLDPLDAVAAGAHLHGRAGERAQSAGTAGASALWRFLRDGGPAISGLRR